LSGKYQGFAKPFSAIPNHSVAQTAQQYLFGLMQSARRNMKRMVEAVPDSDYQGLQNFLTRSSWDDRGIMDRVIGKVPLGGA
jgi:SRSO17 transposase